MLWGRGSCAAGWAEPHAVVPNSPGVWKSTGMQSTITHFGVSEPSGFDFPQRVSQVQLFQWNSAFFIKTSICVQGPPHSPHLPPALHASLHWKWKMEKFIHERWAPFHRGNLVNCSDTSELPYRTSGVEAALLSAEVLPQPDMNSALVFRSPCCGLYTLVFTIWFGNCDIRLETSRQHQLTAKFFTDKTEGVFRLGAS